MDRHWIAFAVFLVSCAESNPQPSPLSGPGDTPAASDAAGISDAGADVTADVQGCLSPSCLVDGVCIPEGAECVPTELIPEQQMWGTTAERTCNAGICCSTSTVCADAWCACAPDEWFGGCFDECEYLVLEAAWKEPNYCAVKCGPPCCWGADDCSPEASWCAFGVPGGNPWGRCVPPVDPPQCWMNSDCGEEEVCEGAEICSCWEDCPDLAPGTCAPSLP